MAQIPVEEIAEVRDPLAHRAPDLPSRLPDRPLHLHLNDPKTSAAGQGAPAEATDLGRRIGVSTSHVDLGSDDLA
jgi:hypothetical protein